RRRRARAAAFARAEKRAATRASIGPISAGSHPGVRATRVDEHMTEPAAFYTVDRIEGAIAVLVGDDGVGMDVPARSFPLRLHEGVVLRVRLGADGTPDWSS